MNNDDFETRDPDYIRERLPGMAFPVDAQPDARPVLTVTSATEGSTAFIRPPNCPAAPHCSVY